MMDKVLTWRDALKTAANISGFDSQTIRLESELVNIVVNDILAKLNRKSEMASGLEGLVGIEKHVRQVESLLCLDSQDVRTVGIWGMGGIGKTTIADVVFHLLSSQFEACCFIANVREASETRHGLNDLRNQLLCTVLKEGNQYVATPSIGSRFARRRLCCTKALVVLDDVSDLGQVEFLVGGDRILFGPGSRIIVTARNKRMLGLDDDKIYKVNELDCDEALELFHLRALTNLSPPTDYTTLSREVVDYAGGNPLALTILGSVFSHCKSKEDWEGELDKLKKFPNKGIHKVLRLSYDGLGENEKEIFLDIACCHKGKHIDEAKRILNACGFSANAGVRLLIDMSLISVDLHSRLVEMHDLIQEMGREIIRDECVKDPGKRSRLWLVNDVCRVLKNNMGTEAIECIVMNMNLITDLYVNAASFEKMHNLRLLDLYSDCYSYTRGVPKVHLPPGFEFLPEALKYLRWHFYPLTSLPPRFSSENLVELHMRHSRLEQLWNKGVQINLGSLKHIDLSDSEHLADVSALIESPILESIILVGCTSLVQLPSSFQHLAKLTRLDLKICLNLKVLPEMPGNLEVLNLDGTAIEELPSSIWSLEKLNHLGLQVVVELKNLPSSTCRLNSLRYLNLHGCLSLGSLPVELPSGLRKLDLRNCKSLRSLPKLPWLLKQLDAHGCTSLETVSSSMRTAPIQGEGEDDEVLLFINCVKLDQSARSNIMADARSRVMRYASRCHSKWRTIKIVYPGNDIPKWMRYQSEGCSINIELPPHSFRQRFLGYALCIVVAFNNYRYLPFRCETHHKTNNGHEERYETLKISIQSILNSDHVFVWYFYHKSFGLDWVKASEASFDFMLYQDTYQIDRREKIPFDLSTVRVKRCGVSLLYEDVGVDEDVVMEPEQVVEKEEIIIKTKRRRDQSEPGGSGTAILKEEDDGELLPQSSKRKINMF